MHCASCSNMVEKTCKKCDGVLSCNVSLLTNGMQIEIDEDKIKTKQIEKAISKAGYKAKLINEKKDKTPSKENDDKPLYKDMLYKRLIPSIILLIPLFYISMAYMTKSEWHWPLFTLEENPFYIAFIEMALSLSILAINHTIILSGFKSLIHLKPNMDALITLGCCISFIYSFIMLFVMAHFAYSNEIDKVMLYSMSLCFETSGMVPTFITIGKTLEEYSKGKTTSALSSLLKLKPDKAIVLKDDKEVEIDAGDLKVGDIFIVKPGAVIPADGIVIDGQSSVDESSLTGESIPVDKFVNDKISSATINQHGFLKCKATQVDKDTCYNKIVQMVETASTSKSHLSNLADRLSSVFVPVVMLLSLIVFIFWMIFGSDFVNQNTQMTKLAYSLERAVSLLVVSCPCALGLATPTAVMVATGKGAKNSILFKNAQSMETLSKIRFIVFDKTGTLTEGKMKVDNVKSFIDKKLFNKLVYSIESKSEHPISVAICKSIDNTNIEKYDVGDFQTLSGFGVVGKIDDSQIMIGNQQLISKSLKITDDVLKETQEYKNMGKIVVYACKDKTLLGYIVLSDQIKEDSKNTIERFKRNGIIPIMLTGDNNLTSKVVSEKLGIEHYYCQLLPEDKLNIIAKLKQYGKVLMVGDGINDAPALTLADVSIAINTGTDVALDAADIICTRSNTNDIANAYILAKKGSYNIIENMFWALIYNLVMMPIAAGVFSFTSLYSLKPWMSSMCMALSSICVVLNALRLNITSLEKDSKIKKVKNIEIDWDQIK